MIERHDDTRPRDDAASLRRDLVGKLYVELAKWINESYRLFAPPPYGDAKVTPRTKKPATTKRKQRG